MRLFLGFPVRLGEKVNNLVSELRKAEGELNFVPLENMHLTVKFLGEVEEKRVGEIKEKMSAIVSEVKPFKVVFKGAGCFSADVLRVVWVGVESSELVSLMKKVNLELGYIRKEEFAEIKPHLTVARIKSGKNKEKILEAVSQFSDMKFGEVIVEKIYLYSSTLTSKGPVYGVVGEFGLSESKNI